MANSKVKRCFVPYCANNSFKTPDKVFISTPTNPIRREQWFAAVSKAYNKPLRSLTSSHCCEDHFTPTTDFANWMEFKLVGTRLKIQPKIVPHIFPEKPAKSVNFAPLSKFAKESIKTTSSDLELNCDVDSLQTDKELPPVSNSCNEKYAMILEKYSLTDLGLPKDHAFLITLLNEETLCSPIHILISLRKIRLNLPFERLAEESSLSNNSVLDMFTSTVPKISELLKQFIIWPDRAKTFLNLPLPCRKKFINLQSVIEFFEIPIDNSDLFVDDSLTKSLHKNVHTMKYLISVNPDGLINFVSPGYGGNTSEIDIIKNCGYLDVLPEKITILGNKSMQEMKDLFSVKDCELITQVSVPVCYHEQVKAFKRQVKMTISKLQDFQMLHTDSCVDQKLIYLLDYIVVICCGLVNSQEQTYDDNYTI